MLALCIRLLSELLLERYTLPMPGPDDSILAQYAHSIIDGHKRRLADFRGGHRSQDAAYYLLPQAESAIMAIGHCSAFAAARDAGIAGPCWMIVRGLKLCHCVC